MKKSSNCSVSHNVCYDKKFRRFLREFFDSYFEYKIDLNGRCGLTRMFRKCLITVFDINPCISIHRRDNGILVMRIDLLSNDGRCNFGFVKACSDDIDVMVDYSGLV